MVDFRKLLSPEARERLDRAKEREAFERQKLASLSDAELTVYAKHCLDNSFGLRRIADQYRGNAVYDSTLIYIILPEVLERLKRR